jgi:two-component sensor histidine kinase
LKGSVREAHHRIRNSLQAVSDLLSLELLGGEGRSSAGPLRDSIDRIQAIALVHDLLSGHDVHGVDARDLMEFLIPRTLSNRGLPPGTVRVEIDVESIALSSRRATTLALIVSELIGSAVCHRFATAPGSRLRGELAVALRRDDGHFVLQVRDKGPALPARSALDTQGRMRLDVVRTLAEGNLQGKIAWTDQSGVLAEVRFPE